MRLGAGRVDRASVQWGGAVLLVPGQHVWIDVWLALW